MENTAIDTIIQALSQRKEAIDQLVKDRDEINKKLAALGYDPGARKTRGRPAGAKNKKAVSSGE